MSDPALEQSLVKLSEVLRRVHQVSDDLNRTIAEFEQKLIKLNPGIAVWCGNPIAAADSVRPSLLGFGKHEEEWGLWVRRGLVTKKDGVWEPDNDSRYKVTLIRLLDANREERAAAIKEFPGLVEALTLMAQQHLENLERATKSTR